MTVQTGNVLSSIYDAALDHRLWTPALTQISDYMQARAAVLVVRDRGQQAYQIMALSQPYDGLMATVALEYMQNYVQFEAPDWDAFDRLNAGEPSADTALGLTPEERDARPDYVFLRENFDVRRRLGLRLNENRVWFDAMTTIYDAKRKEIPNEAYARTRALAPHLAKSIEIGRMFSELRKRYRQVLGVLDRVGVGLAIAHRTGEIIVHNTEAARIFDLDDGLTLGAGGHLMPREADLEPAIRVALEAAHETARGEGASAGQVIVIPRPSRRMSLVLDIAPLRDPEGELDADAHAALVVLIDPDHVPYLNLERFRSLYRLTPSETEVASQLLQGRSIQEIAQTRGTRYTTTKNQLASIFAKTGTGNRSQLVHLIVRVLPPVH